MRYKLFLLSLFALLTSFSVTDDLQYRIIRNENFKMEFYIHTINRTSYDDHKRYYWYKSGEIHSSFGAAGGQLLEDEFIKYYKNNQLAEKGEFRDGLKDGEWRAWHKNGYIESIVEWRKGLKSGGFQLFDNAGNLLASGKYRNNMKQGKWIDYQTADTLNYRRGKVRVKDTLKKEFFLKRFWNKIFKKKKADTIPQNTSKIDTLKKKSFFKRLFGSKKKKEDEEVEN